MRPTSQASRSTGKGEGATGAGWLRTLQWWPSLAGAAFAAFVARDLFNGSEEGSGMAPVLAASGLVYLAAAALHRPMMAWWMFFVAGVVITADELGALGLNATWVLLGLAALLALYGLVRAGAQLSGLMTLQTAGMVGFGGAAAFALLAAPETGSYLVAAGLLCHAGWDVWHHWTGKVVVRSLAEFCFVLDVALAAAIIYATSGQLTR